MKLITLNVGLFEANNTLVQKFLRREKPDIVCFQEVTRRIEKEAKKEYISKETIDRGTPDLQHAFFGPCVTFKDIAADNFHGQEHFYFSLGGFVEMGNYTRSRYSMTHGQNVFVENYFTYEVDHSGWPDEEYRAVLVTDLTVRGKKLRILNYHGVWTRNKLGNKKSLRANATIRDLALTAPGQVIICGDFNLFPHTRSMKVFEKNFTSLVDTFGIQTTRLQTNELNHLRNVVDYIWISKKIKVKNFSAVATNVSDHLPLVLDFTL